MRLVLAGASGFMGEHLLARLGDDHEVYALSRRRPSTLAATHSWVETDFNAGIDTSQLPERADAVVHLAAGYGHREFPDSAADLFAVNTASVVTLADWARQRGVSSFTYMSTGSVYATDGPDAQREDSPTAPTAFWTVTKRAGEMLIDAYASEFEVWIPRLFFPYGAGQRDRLIPNLIESVREGHPVTVPTGSDGLVLAPIHIDDATEIVATALDQRWSGLMNIAGPRPYTLRAIVEEIGRQVGHKPVVESVAGPPPARFEPDLSRLDAAYGLDRLAGFPVGLARTLAPLPEEAAATFG